MNKNEDLGIYFFTGAFQKIAEFLNTAFLIGSVMSLATVTIR
jgi:hypothetical protein